MKKHFFFVVIFSFSASPIFSQPNKYYYAYVNPISIAFRNPTLGLEFFIKKSWIDAIQIEGSYTFQDHQIGGFLQRGYEKEKSVITPFVSYPRNRIPVFVYNGTTFRVGVAKYFYSKKIHQYVAVSGVLKIFSYDSLKVGYNNTPREKRDNFYDNVEHRTHSRMQNEKLNAYGLGLEYGIEHIKNNIIINFFARINAFYGIRKMETFNEEFNTYLGDNLISSARDNEVKKYEIEAYQLRPQVGVRLGLTNW